ncbi:hypothetical protein TCAL_13092 [Tigriopus californicus]|uniref:Sushi domain-containing protein n=1 Tax=Tigriopus californicus TaxID=6832 RepID=A0A553PLB8_TIGCA|nr:hypothetical protein TCAL_13092 [Tigriopus californicus]
MSLLRTKDIRQRNCIVFCRTTCAPGYDLLGHVTDGRTCYKVTNTTNLDPFDEDFCNAPEDESRWLGTPENKLYTEEVTGLMRRNSGMGDCVPDCPSEEAEVACLEEPDFPEFVQDDESRYFRNYSTTYEQGRGWSSRRFHEHHALCSLSQLEYQYLFDKSAKCEPVVCPCPPWFANNSIEGTSDWHNEGGATKCPEDQSVLYGTNVTYTCPEGYVFETPQLIAFQEETSVLTLTCEKYADWSLGVKPKCIPVNCTSDPPRVNNDDRGWYDWDLAVRNKSYLHEITYRTCAENPPQPFMNMVQDWPKDSLKLGTTVEYQCSVNRVTEKEQVTRMPIIKRALLELVVKTVGTLVEQYSPIKLNSEGISPSWIAMDLEQSGN